MNAAIPEGATTVSGEGRDLTTAVADAASKLEVPAARVGYKLDMAHFRAASGSPIARDTVRIIAWARSEEEVAAEPPPRVSSGGEGEARESRRREDREPREPRESRESRSRDESEANLGETDASRQAQAWFTRLLELMDIEGDVKAGGNEERVRLFVKADKAGRIIGKRGSTLSAIRHLLGLQLRSFGELIVDVDVDDARPTRSEGSSDRPRDRERSRDRDGGRGRDRDRGRGRGRDRGDRGDRGDRDDRREKGKYPPEKLQAVGRRAAERAMETGKPVTINLELNSYDRRIVHLEVGEIEGVESRSVLKDGVKYIQVAPLG